MLALIVLVIAPWAFVAAPTYTLLPLSVGAPELSPWLLVLALVAMGLALGALSGSPAHPQLARLALVAAGVAVALPAVVLVQIPGAHTRFDQEWVRVFGAAPEGATISWRQAFTGLSLADVRVTRDVPVRTIEGVPLTVNITRPMSDAPAPVVVQIYGGAWRNGEPADDPQMAHALAASGFVVFSIDYRHAPAFRWPAPLEDVLDALLWIRTHAAEYGGDATRVALIGRSAGAQLAMRASQDPRAIPIAAVVSLYGPVDLLEGYHKPPSPDPLDVRAVEAALFGATPDERPDLYVDASPITRATLPHPPVLLITGGRDHIVEPRFGKILHEALLTSGTSVLLNMPWADHAFDAVPFGPSSQTALFYTRAFLRNVLQ